MTYQSILSSIDALIEELLMERKTYHHLLLDHKARPESFEYVQRNHKSFKTSSSMTSLSAHQLIRIVAQENKIEALKESLVKLTEDLRQVCSTFPVFQNSPVPTLTFLFRPDYEANYDKALFNFLDSKVNFSNPAHFALTHQKFACFDFAAILKGLQNLQALPHDGATYQHDIPHTNDARLVWKICPKQHSTSDFCLVSAKNPKDALLYATFCGFASLLNLKELPEISLSRDDVKDILSSFSGQ